MALKPVTLPTCWLWLAAACSAAIPASVPPGPLAAAGDSPRYDLTVRLDPDSARLHATGTILLPPADSPTVAVPLALDRMMGRLRVDVVEPAALAGPVAVDSVGSGGRDVHWLVRLPAAVPAGTPLRLRFSCSGTTRTPGFLFYLAGDVVYASGWGTNWYPGLGDGTTKAVGTLRVHAPARYPTVIASGMRPVEGDSATGWHTFVTSRPIYFSILAGRFHATRHDGPIPVTVYALEPRPGAAAQAATAARALEVLQREFGPYRFGEMALVEYPDSLALGFNAASEPGVLILKSGFLRGPPNLANYGHELGHQWWPHVTNFRRAHALMVEAMANYAAFRVVEELGGPAVAERFRRSGEPGFNGEINALFYLMNAAAGFDTTLLEFDYREGTLPGRNMGGVKGAFVIDMLAQEVGRDRFRRELARILAAHEGQAVSWQEFVAEVERGTGRDLGWFSAQWTGRAGAPEWRLAWSQDGATLHGVVTQDPPYYRATLPVQAASADAGSRVRDVVVDGPRTEFTWPLPFRAQRVEMDPRYRLLWWTPGYRARANALAPVTGAYARRSLDELREAMRRVPAPDTHGYAFLAHLSMARLLSDRNEPDSVAAHARAALAAPTRDPELVSLAYAQLALVARARGDLDTLRWAVAGAIAADAAADVAGASVWLRGMAPP